MTNAIKKYSIEAKKLLSGQIKGSRYSNEVRKELDKINKCYDPGYIRFVVNSLSDQDEIWDAVTAVLKARKCAGLNQQQLTDEIKELVA